MVRILLGVSTILALGCGGLSSDDDGRPIGAVGSLTCASAAMGPSGWDTHRVQLTAQGPADEFALVVVTGRTYAESGLPQATPVEFSSTAQATEADGMLTFAFPEGRIQIFEQGSTSIYAGTIVLDDAGAQALALACWNSRTKLSFRYNPTSGVCERADGRVGFNSAPLPYVRETGDGECADLQGVMLNEDNLSYPVLRAWNLKGADLTEAQLAFADLLDADLHGARMDTLSYGYANISGSIDSFTVMPVSGCQSADWSLDCQQ